VAQGVITVPLDASTPLPNASAVAGKVAVTQRGSANFAVQCQNCFNAGAIAVVGLLDPGSAGQTPGTRGGTAASVTIPCLQLTYEDGTNILAHGTTDATSALRFSVRNEDCNLTLGSYDGGRGASDTTFLVSVPQPGVYPIRLVWENGGGDANCEFFTMDVLGNKTPINDPVSSVKAWITRVATAPTISLSNVGGVITVNFTGWLQAASSVTGPYEDVITTTPYTVPSGSAAQFFRAYMP